MHACRPPDVFDGAGMMAGSEVAFWGIILQNLLGNLAGYLGKRGEEGQEQFWWV